MVGAVISDTVTRLVTIGENELTDGPTAWDALQRFLRQCVDRRLGVLLTLLGTLLFSALQTDAELRAAREALITLLDLMLNGLRAHPDASELPGARRRPLISAGHDNCHAEVLTASTTRPPRVAPWCRQRLRKGTQVQGDEVLSIAGLRHAYGRTLALDGVDLTVASGECVALLGPNGAGKTTLVNAVTGLLRPTAGRVRIAGADPRRAETRLRIGVVQQSAGFPRTLKVGELVSGWAVRYGRPASAAGPVLEEIGITDLANRRTTKLSGGQQQRLQLALALVADPALLVLDEPTVGLDAASRRAFWRILAARREAGAGVLLTTHQIDEAAATADRVVVLHEGRVVASDRPIELTSRLPDRTISARTRLDVAHLRALPGVISATVDDGRAHVTTTQPEATVRRLLDDDAGLTDLRVEAAGLEEAVLAITSTTEEVAA